MAAKTLADQWIPIKPGTDTAMFMALAYVLFEKDLWNKEFVAKYVEPVGFPEMAGLCYGQEKMVFPKPRNGLRRSARYRLRPSGLWR